MKKILIITTVLFLSSCGTNFEFDEITIKHQSVATNPEYERNYTIEATPSNIHVVISGHNTTILDTNFNNTSSQFAEYVKAYEYLKLGKTELDTTCKICPVREVAINKDKVELYHAKWNIADNHPALQRLVDVVINSVPNFGELLARPEKE